MTADYVRPERRAAASSWDGSPRLAEAALAWLQGAIGTDATEIVYHRGDLAVDAPPRPSQSRAALRLRLAADRLRAAAAAGTITLLQRRHDEHDYEYIARRVTP
jgi:hypothetical protein